MAGSADAPERATLNVHSCSSEDAVHKSTNVVLDVLYRQWQTSTPSDSAWIAVDLDPPSAIQRLAINNAGSALVEVYGLQEGADDATNDVTDDVSDDITIAGGYEMLLPAQQFMSAADVREKKNTNREFVYEAGTKLLKTATEHKWARLKLVCKQPFGVPEEPIGLARVRVYPCMTRREEATANRQAAREAKIQAAVAESDAKQKKVLSPAFHLPLAKLSDEPADLAEPPPKEPPKPTGKRVLPSWLGGSATKPAKPPDDDGTLKARGKKRGAPDGAPEREEKRTKGGVGKAGKKEGGKEKDDVGSGGRPKETEERGTEGRGAKTGRGDRNGGATRKGGKSSFRKESEQSEDSDERATSAHERATSAEEQATSAEARATSAKRHPRGGFKREGKTATEPESEEEPAAVSGRDVSRKVPFEKLLEGVTFAISAIQNPERGKIRTQGEEMGAEYRADWGPGCTLLVCAYKGTPKFNQVKKANGTIVDRDWIPECHKRGELVDIDAHILHPGKPWRKQTGAKVEGSWGGREPETETEDDATEESGRKAGRRNRSDADVRNESRNDDVRKASGKGDDDVRKATGAGYADVRKATGAGDADVRGRSGKRRTGGATGIRDAKATRVTDADVARWVDADVAEAERFLKSEGAEPGPGETMRDLGVQGVLGCFDYMVEELESGLGLEEAKDGWVAALPTGVRSVCDVAGGGNVEAVSLLREMKARYERALQRKTNGTGLGEVGEKQGQLGRGEEEDESDAVTEGLSDAEEGVGESDVVILSKKQIAEAKAKILERYG